MKTCYYVLLGVEQNASDLELKKGYRRKALQYHPDKNPDNVEEATEIFANIRSAYEVLSDPQERAWYDSHREQILSDAPLGGNVDEYEDYEVDASVTGVTTDELLMFFNTSLYTKMNNSPAGIYQIAGMIFAKLAKDEVLNGRKLGLNKFDKYQDDHFENETNTTGYLKAVDNRGFTIKTEQYIFPQFGYSTTDYEYLKNFYKKWSGFTTLKSFSWKDEYMYSRTYDRRTKREINKRNEKARQEARNEYIKTVKRFVTFIKKLDVRMKIGAKQAVEAKKLVDQKKKDEMKASGSSKKTNTNSSHNFEPQSWQAVDEPDWDALQRHYEEDRNSTVKDSDGVEIDLNRVTDSKSAMSNHQNNVDIAKDGDDTVERVFVYECYVCNKTFKSENQLMNHSKTNMHKKNVRKIQWEMKKESMALGLDNLSDLDEFDSAQSSVGNVEDELTQDDVDLEQLNKEIEEIERQLAEGLTSEDESDDAEILEALEKEFRIDEIQVELNKDEDIQTDQVSSDSSSFTSEDEIDKVDDALNKILESLNDENIGIDSDSDDDWSTNKKKKKSKPRTKTKKGNSSHSSVSEVQSNTGKDTIFSEEQCGTCGASFDSRNKLFQHVKTSGHAAPIKKVKASVKKSKKRMNK